MAEEFKATASICGGGGGAWWNSPRSVMSPSDHFLSPCFGAAITSNDFSSQENHLKSRMTCTDNNNIVFGQREADSDSGGSTVTMDSTLQMMGLGFSSNCSSDWNQTILQEDLNSSFIRSSQDQDHGQGFLSTTTSPYILNPACSSSPSTSSSSSLIRTFYDPEPSPYNFVSTTSGSINDPQLSWANKTNPHHQVAYGLINSFSNNANSRPFWNSSSTTNLNNTTPNNFVTTPQIISTRLEDKTKNLKTRAQSESLKRAKDNESAAKKPRVTTPSPLPTFKVRKENLRDQITSLQQLVSPFGKTDTASVLQEAIEYIKFLHDQVTVLSTPYMKQGASNQQQQQVQYTI
ncbi:Myc-type basic helix-loop-helix (bHLH) domain [Arabidopsis suecica]|uniref:Myc-type basic helix-loop-helix (BHLH) domain n=1 Tax=Arabidopsis suecica TaxID=45249 RepID=A0A8T2HFA7_ARASU|nr:Myc-type basic helix-loop-helix (bHLH) domain [Arabidopsis suecica]